MRMVHPGLWSILQMAFLIIALLFLLVNLATDLLYRVIDPRVRSA